jgi:Na+/glutamate symporter
MSGHGFHVHGPHDHELEHAASGGHGNDHGHGANHADDAATQGGMSMTSKIAVCTAVIATVGAIFSYMGGATQANAGLYKNNAAIKKTEASNQWNYFQSKSTKQALAEFARDTAADDNRRQGWQVKVARYEQEKTDIQTAARKLEDESNRWDAQSEEQMHQHHRWAQATTVLQVSIALAAMALLTKKKWLERGMFGVAVAGLAIGVLAALHV